MSDAKKDLVIEAKFKTLSIIRKKRKQEPKDKMITKQKFLSDSEYTMLKNNMRRSTGRDAIVIKLFMYTGARAQEGLAVRLMDLDWDTRTVFIKGMKGSNNREIPLPRWYFIQLWHYARKMCKSPDDRIFPFCYTILRRTWVFHRPVKKKIHALRHTIAIRVFRSQKDIKLVQILLGHRSIMNTMIYLDYVYSQNEMQKILKVDI